MLEQITTRFAITLALLLTPLFFSSCSMFSKSASDQRAYDRYVKQHSGIQHKQQRQKAKMARTRSPMPVTPAPGRMTAEASDGPQSVSSGESQSRQ